MTNPDLTAASPDLRVAQLAADLETAKTRLAAIAEREARAQISLQQAHAEIVTLKKLILEQKQQLETRSRLREDLVALKNRLKQAERRNAQLDRQIAQIHASTSWRITRPLRALISVLKRKSGRT